ncbi:MAG: DarT ssDNA thymidine ADP-ribosyltransferase family protein [Acidobacteria bacterium]|nr:DarT ssDNA thymidine ADP-ribosyltransferase family protein [Acidobacteriota bacterium]
MPEIDPLRRIPHLYHFTDRRNLQLIRDLGGLYPLAELEERNVAIPAPGSDEGSRFVDRQRDLHKYIHLCFKSVHPMEFVARQQGRIGDTIFLQIHASVLHWEGVLFAPGMANTNNIQFLPVEQAGEMIDYEVLYTRTNWADPDVQKRLQAAEKYEILVPKAIPLDLIRNLPHG